MALKGRNVNPPLGAAGSDKPIRAGTEYGMRPAKLAGVRARLYSDRVTTGDSDFHAWLSERQANIDRAVIGHFQQFQDACLNSTLLEAVLYSMQSGGKRFRPVLLLECCRACGGDEARAMPAAIAVECVHAFSLIHDDLPAMDDDDLRRGRPTCHRAFDEATAILAGDWLLAHAFEVLAGHGDAKLASELSRATRDMIFGQAADLAGEARPPDESLVRFIHLHKTARLIEACCRMGARVASAPPARVEALGEFGRRLGQAFQIADDLLDETGAVERTGKQVRKDKKAAKQTLPAALGLDESVRRAASEVGAAINSLAELGAEADRLRGLARFVLSRDA
ncbi:Farnesyl diphosphate synthase [Phycisphaerae bacterium RAS1]|nr:Farnesyl diphosphate synthase [Phycisphaerae bacterium RAS1]